MTPKKRCFIIMPFGKYGTPDYDRNMKIYQLMIKPVVEKCGYESIRADELEHVGSITRDIIELLHGSELVIADLTGKNANVFYELGVRHVLYRCGTIPIIRHGESLPFDIANYRAIFYTSELDGPEMFKSELERRIKAFEKYQTEKSDNPVHDTLGDSLQYVNLKDYVSLSDYNAKQQENDNLKKEFEKLNQQYKTISSDEKQLKKKIDAQEEEKSHLNETIKKLEQQLKQAQQASHKIKKDDALNKPQVQFRVKPTDLSSDDVNSMLKKYNFFDSSKNKNSSGFKNQYDVQDINGDQVVIDSASRLMWQQGGSSDSMEFKDAEKWIADLNKKSYAGFSDWRLPTLEEAMSLMEPEKKNEDLYIDPVFDKKQSRIWTADRVKGESWAWVVDFDLGYCYDYNLGYNGLYVRAVRPGQSSVE